MVLVLKNDQMEHLLPMSEEIDADWYKKKKG